MIESIQEVVEPTFIESTLDQLEALRWQVPVGIAGVVLAIRKGPEFLWFLLKAGLKLGSKITGLSALKNRLTRKSPVNWAKRSLPEGSVWESAVGLKYVIGEVLPGNRKAGIKETIRLIADGESWDNSKSMSISRARYILQDCKRVS